MGIVTCLKSKFKRPEPKLFSELSYEEKKSKVARGLCYTLCTAHYLSIGNIRLSKKGTNLVAPLLPEQIEKSELENFLDKTITQQEFDELDYFTSWYEKAITEDNHSVYKGMAFYETLNKNLEEREKETRAALKWDMMNGPGFILLLGAYLLDQAEDQDLLTRVENDEIGLILKKNYG